MQGGGRAGSRLLNGLAALTGIDGRPLAFAFAVCGGAALYFSLSKLFQLVLMDSVQREGSLPIHRL